MRKIMRMIIFSKAFIWTLVFATFLFGWMPPESQAMLAPAELTSAEPIPNRAADIQKDPKRPGSENDQTTSGRFRIDDG